jgi:hypothetical protein
MNSDEEEGEYRMMQQQQHRQQRGGLGTPPPFGGILRAPVAATLQPGHPPTVRRRLRPT